VGLIFGGGSVLLRFLTHGGVLCSVPREPAGARRGDLPRRGAGAVDGGRMAGMAAAAVGRATPGSEIGSDFL
jgi:hypothetical protein